MSELEFERVLATARASIDLLARSAIAPVPPAFSIVYHVLDESAPDPEDDIAGGVRERLERANDQAAEALRRSDFLLAGMDAVSETIESAKLVSERFNTTLATASEGLEPASVDVNALRMVLNHLVSETERVRSSSVELAVQVASSRREFAQLKAEIERARQEAARDSLTLISNRRHFDESIGSMIETAEASGKDLAIVLFDVDHFRRFNNSFGHQTGDSVLRDIARILAEVTTPDDVIARFGGEEFVALLANTNLDGARFFVERFRRALAAFEVMTAGKGQSGERITASYGIAAYRDGDDHTALVERADQCLYAAKQAGRDRIVDQNSLGSKAPPPVKADSGQSLLDVLADI